MEDVTPGDAGLAAPLTRLSRWCIFACMLRTTNRSLASTPISSPSGWSRWFRFSERVRAGVRLRWLRWGGPLVLGRRDSPLLPVL